MNKIRMIVSAMLCSVMLLAGSMACAAPKAKNTPPKEWTVWLESLKREMISKGISQKTIDEAYKGKNYYHPLPEVVQLRRSMLKSLVCGNMWRVVPSKAIPVKYFTSHFNP